MSPQVFQILLSLADGPKHGYAVIQDIRERTRGEIRLTASTLYDALARMVDQSFIEEVPAPTQANPRAVQGSPPIKNDARRRYYQLTAGGRRAATDETRRLERTIAMAKEKLAK